MNLAEKVIGAALIGLIALISWNLMATVNLQQEILTIQHEQKHMHETTEKKLQKIIKKLKRKANK